MLIRVSFFRQDIKSMNDILLTFVDSLSYLFQMEPAYIETVIKVINQMKQIFPDTIKYKTTVSESNLLLPHEISPLTRALEKNLPVKVVETLCDRDTVNMPVKVLEYGRWVTKLPLEIAAYGIYPELVNVLLERGADVQALSDPEGFALMVNEQRQATKQLGLA